MYLLTNDEMFNVVGGAKGAIWTIVAGVVSFVIGVFAGFKQTKACKVR